MNLSMCMVAFGGLYVLVAIVIFIMTSMGHCFCDGTHSQSMAVGISFAAAGMLGVGLSFAEESPLLENKE